MAAGCALSAELENTGRLFSTSINTCGVARALVVSLKARCVAGAFGVCQLGMEGLSGLFSPFAGLCLAVLATSQDTQFISKC